MAFCIAKKVFSVLDTPDKISTSVEEFLSSAPRDGRTVEVHLYASGRLKKRDAHEIIHRLIGERGIKEAGCNWEHGPYNFLFSTENVWHRFFRDGKTVHITAAEGLFLFRRLILEEASDRYVLYNMRRRLGKDFLKDIESVKKLPPDHNVDCAFLDNHERNRGKREAELVRERRALRLI
jgi:hypothetical protein